jgi:hypothetical protein
MPPVQRLIVNTLKGRQYSPVELLEILQTNEVSEGSLKDALAQLIDSRTVEFSRTRQVRLREKV